MGQFFQKISVLTLLFFVLVLSGCKDEPGPDRIRGWFLSSDNPSVVEQTLKSAEKYKPQMLILSGNVIHYPGQLADPVKRRNLLTLVRKALKADITTVILTDKGWEGINFYPDTLKTEGKINLDKKEFWHWLRVYYHQNMGLLPEAEGIVLDLSETADSIAGQYSEVLPTGELKKAAFVDSLAAILTDASKKFYLRGFYDYRNRTTEPAEEYKLLKNPNIVVIEKEAPVPTLITHPVSAWIEKIPFRVLVEFDLFHKHEGQSTVASILAALHLQRWNEYQKMANVTGMVVTDIQRGETEPAAIADEVNFYALQQAVIHPDAPASELLIRFLIENYGPDPAEALYKAFEKCPQIILSTYFTLGLATSDDSKLDFENPDTYTSLVSGRWMAKPVMSISNDPDNELNYWSDIVNHLAPPHLKNPMDSVSELYPYLADSLISPGEMMDTTWLRYVMAEKENGVRLAKEALNDVKFAKSYLYYPDLFNPLYHLFNRTLISARIRKSYAQVYYGQRIWNRGIEYQNDSLLNFISLGVEDLSNAVIEMKEYSEKGPETGYVWVEDGKPAEKLLVSLIKSGILSRPKTEAKK